MTINNGESWADANTTAQDSNNSTSFPDEWKNEFEGLLYLGYLQKEITQIPFHHFVVRTLTVNEKLEVSLLSKPYMDSIGYARAYKAAIVAAGLVSVDHKPLIATNRNTNVVRQKYEYVINNWYDAVTDILFDAIDDLENQVVLVLEELGILELPPVINVFEDNDEGIDTPKGGK